MDALDIAVFRELLQADMTLPLSTDPHRSLRSIAKKLGVDKDTVRKRIRAMEGRGFLKGPLVFPNPGLVGLNLHQHWVDLEPGSKREAIERIERDRNVVVVTEHLGESLTFAGVSRATDPFEGWDSARADLRGLQGRRSATIRMPKPEVVAADQDWRILRPLLEDPSQSLPSLSRKAGLSTRTLERRLKRLIEARALFVLPRFDPKALDGTLVDYAVFYDEDAKKEELDRRILKSIDRKLFHADLADPAHSFFNFIVSNVAEVQRDLAWVSGSKGVAAVRPDLVIDRIELMAHVAEIFSAGVGSG